MRISDTPMQLPLRMPEKSIWNPDVNDACLNGSESGVA